MIIVSWFQEQDYHSKYAEWVIKNKPVFLTISYNGILERHQGITI